MSDPKSPKLHDLSELKDYRRQIATDVYARFKLNQTVNIVPDDSGLLNTHVKQKGLHMIRGAAEQMLQNQGATIVLGRERLAGIGTSYGGKGASPHGKGTNAIRLTSGPGSRGSSGKGYKDGTHYDPSFYNDAATIYCSDITDPDTAIGTCDGPLGNQKTQSAIINFADQLRYFGVGGVQICTGHPTTAKGMSQTGMITSHGGKIEQAPPIVLSAGNTDGTKPIWGLPGISANDEVDILQGVARGQNTTECIRELSNILDKVIGALIRLGIYQGAFAAILGITVPPGIQPHHAGAAGIMVNETYASFITSLVQLRLTKVFWEIMYCEEGSSKSVKSLNVFSS
tara:strand:+ start:8161 stop:9186 length:1026 start_codon:yes stop_codon:yes gene_type:complete